MTQSWVPTYVLVIPQMPHLQLQKLRVKTSLWVWGNIMQTMG
jgi:hypothetical protein